MTATEQHEPVAPTETASAGTGVATVVTGAMLLLLLGGIAAYVLDTDGFLDAIPVFAMIALALAALFGERVSTRVRAAATRGSGAAKTASSLGGGLDRRSWLLPALGFLAVVVVLGELPDKGQDPFFSAAAQVIPVLALALAVEATAFHERLQTDAVGRATALITLLLLLYGEFEALEGLASTERDGNDAELVWGALTAGALGLVLVSIRAAPLRPEK